ncbi:MAG TPA: cytidine deaminase [Clostridiaceae bacterium]|nr:cytidine deaminase [Clostridiaceae bacterium]
MNINKKKQLIKEAIKASENSYSPYSNFRVGAAILCADQKIFTGCNVENASYGATICAERAAAIKAVSEGAKRFIAIAVYGYPAGSKDNKNAKEDQEFNYAFPCGICRQVLNEFADPDMIVLIVRSENNYLERTLAELLPDSFGSANLE